MKDTLANLTVDIKNNPANKAKKQLEIEITW